MESPNKGAVKIKSQVTANLCGKIFGSNHLHEYTENTTIHGVKYLGDRKRPVVEKIFWILIFILCFVFLGLFINDVLAKWRLKSTILVEDDQPTPIYKIPFPAVTVCPTTKIKHPFMLYKEYQNFWNTLTGLTMPIELAFLICNQQFVSQDFPIPMSNAYFKFFNKSHIDLLHKMSPTFEDTFKYIRFNEFSHNNNSYQINKSVSDNDTLFSPILTNEGICFTFNLPSDIITDEPTLQTDYRLYNLTNPIKAWNYEHGFTGYPSFPRITWGSGLKNGLQFMVSSHIDHLNRICQPTKTGYKIILHSPAVYPTTLDHFIPINHNTVTAIKVTPKIIKTSNDLRKYDPQTRQCIYNDERKLKYYKFYNRVNCKLECLANYTLKQYACVHFSLPRSVNESMCGANIKINDLFDTEENINSYQQFREEWKQTPTSDDDFHNFLNFHCNCLPECNSLEYDYSIYTEDVELEKLRQQENFEEISTTNKLSEVLIYFKSTKETGLTRKQFYTLSDLVSNFGGLVGLFMGASVLSVFEIIYFFAIRKLTRFIQE